MCDTWSHSTFWLINIWNMFGTTVRIHVELICLFSRNVFCNNNTCRSCLHNAVCLLCIGSVYYFFWGGERKINMMGKHTVSLPDAECLGHKSPGIRCISKETEMDGSFPIYSSKIYVNALNTMRSLWSVTQAWYSAEPEYEERKGHGPLWSGSGLWRG